ncbi:MAG TPA: twin transmembrane helix small protein [Gammaproteobacteria bacterium]|nr:twin transmembrane helix small protein [Gammaproteobacteria bacterium]
MWIQILIIVVFAGILVSLFSGLYYLVKDKGTTTRTARALTFRIGLSLGLFLFLMALIGLGVIEPHGLYPANHPVAQKARDAG